MILTRFIMQGLVGNFGELTGWLPL